MLIIVNIHIEDFYIINICVYGHMSDEFKYEIRNKNKQNNYKILILFIFFMSLTFVIIVMWLINLHLLTFDIGQNS